MNEVPDSYRRLISSQAKYLNQIRDREIESKGIKVTVRYRLSGSVNEYGDPTPTLETNPIQVDDDGQSSPVGSSTPSIVVEDELWCVPYYEAQRVGFGDLGLDLGLSLEEDPTLEVAFKTTDRVTEEAEIDLPAISLGNGRYSQAQTWVVLSMNIRSTTHDVIENIARCAPKRRSIEPNEQTLITDGEITDVDGSVVDFGDGYYL